MDDIDQQSRAVDFSSTPRTADGYASSSVFDADHPSREVIEVGHTAAQQLIDGDLVFLEEAVASVDAARGILYGFATRGRGSGTPPLRLTPGRR